MANANVTPAHRSTRHTPSAAYKPLPTASADRDDALPLLLSLLTKLTDQQIVALVDGIGTPRLKRQLLLTMHRLIRYPKKDPATLALVDGWFSAMPELLRLVGPGTHTHALIQWTDSAAEAYVMN